MCKVSSVFSVPICLPSRNAVIVTVQSTLPNSGVSRSVKLEILLPAANSNASAIRAFDDVQLIVDLAKTCETMDFYDEEAMSILLEEMGDLVSGNIDLDTAVERMQSRLNLYLMEQVK